MKKKPRKGLILALVLIISFSTGIILDQNNNKSNKTIPKKAKFVDNISYYTNWGENHR